MTDILIGQALTSSVFGSAWGYWKQATWPETIAVCIWLLATLSLITPTALAWLQTYRGNQSRYTPDPIQFAIGCASLVAFPMLWLNYPWEIKNMVNLAFTPTRTAYYVLAFVSAICTGVFLWLGYTSGGASTTTAKANQQAALPDSATDSIHEGSAQDYVKRLENQLQEMEEYASNAYRVRLHANREMSKGSAEYSYEEALTQAKQETSNDKVALLIASIQLLNDRIHEPVKDRTGLDDWMIGFDCEREVIGRVYGLVSANSKQFSKLVLSENDVPTSERREVKNAFNALHEKQLNWVAHLIKQLTQAREMVETTKEPPGIGLKIKSIEVGRVVGDRSEKGKSIVAIDLVATNTGPDSAVSNWQLEVMAGNEWLVVSEPASTDAYFTERDDEVQVADLKRISEQTQKPIPTGDFKVGFLVGLVDSQRTYVTENGLVKIALLRIGFMDISGHQKQYLYDSTTDTFHRIK